MRNGRTPTHLGREFWGIRKKMVAMQGRESYEFRCLFTSKCNCESGVKVVWF